MSREWSMRSSLIFLISSTVFTLIVGVCGLWVYKNYRNDQLTNPKYYITAIIQTGPEKEALKTSYLAEILGLSADCPQNLYAFDIKRNEAKALASPVIKSIKIKRLPPSALYVDYEVRKPIAYIADFENIGVDQEGYIFPVHPFFSPKRLPEVYLGLKDASTSRVEGPHFNLALEILKFLETAPWEAGLRATKVDVSKAFKPSLGQREIILTTEEEIAVRGNDKEIVCTFPKIIRLCPKDYAQQLVNFFQLQKTIMGDYRKQLASLKQGGRFSPRIVDLRIPQLAFVEKGS